MIETADAHGARAAAPARGRGAARAACPPGEPHKIRRPHGPARRPGPTLRPAGAPRSARSAGLTVSVRRAAEPRPAARSPPSPSRHRGACPAADLDERDPDYIRETLPRPVDARAASTSAPRCAASRTSPRRARCCWSGNHSGGNLTPDTGVFTLAFSTYFGVERRFHQLAHNLVLSMPGLGWLRKYGTVAATPQNAERALDEGAALLVYPGGDYEVHRPIWESATVDFGGRKGFIRLAKQKGVPIVPVVSVGGQETALFLTRGEGLAKLLAARPDVPPEGAADLALAAVGRSTSATCSATSRCPRRSRSQVLAADRRRASMDVDEAYDHVLERMQRTLSRAAGRAPPAGDRMRVEKSVVDRRLARGDLGADLGPVPTTRASCAASRACKRKSDGPRDRAWARATRCTSRSARPRSAGWSRSWSSTSRPTSPGRASPASTSACAGACARPTTARTRVTLRLAYDAPGGVLGAVSEQVSKPMVARNLEQTLQNLRAEIEGGADEVSDGT